MLDPQALDVLFRTARTHNGFRDDVVSDADLRAIFDLMKWGPTSANSQPARFVFLRTSEAKQRLAPALGPNNLQKTLSAPVAVIVAYDLHFYEHLPRVFPHNQDAINWFRGEEKKTNALTTAFRNGTLQGGYFILAARALGFDCGPMSGFDNAKLDAEFFPDGRFKSNFLINLGRGDPSKLFGRSPRFEFDDVCTVL